VPVREERRPDPEKLLRKVEADEKRESRGRLKVFLGYASRVGKSYRMFDEGRRRKERGQDVIVGALQSGVTPDIQAILSRLEVVATISSTHEGKTYETIDLPAIFGRHPQVCLIDGLAYDNPPGSRNRQRWEDVAELLNQGIAIITAVNVQHIREQQSAVERITGKRSPYSIPQGFLLEADEIEIVDAPPEALLDRGQDGGAANSRGLAELRELALLLAADVVERQLQEYLESHGVAAGWGAQERILVCLTPRSNAVDMLRSGHRNAQRFHGALLAAYVEQDNLRPEDRVQLDSHMALAQELGAELHRLHHPDFVQAILEFAREQRITQLFVGHSLGDQDRRLFRSPIDRLIDAAEDFDVRLFPHPDAQ
jgi:two-component system sensor histidine kinase KdpD